MVALLVLLTLIVFLTFDYLASRRNARQFAEVGELAMNTAASSSTVLRGATPESMLPPVGVFLTRTHQWVSLLAEGRLRMGMDPLRVKALGTAETVDLPEPGTLVRRGDPVATLHRQGRGLTLHAPVDGRVVSVNERVELRPHRLTSDPYRSGWLCEIVPESLNLSFLESAFRNRDAERWLRGELRRVRDFLAMGSESAPAMVLQDGGLPVHGFGGQLDDEQWHGLVQTFFSPDEVPSATAEPKA